MFLNAYFEENAQKKIRQEKKFELRQNNLIFTKIF